MLAIEEIAYNSPLRGTNPKAKIAFGFVPLVLCLCLDSLAVSVLLVVIMAISAVFVSKITPKKYLHLMLIPFSFLIIGTITIIVGRCPAGSKVIIGFNAFNQIYGITIASLEKGIHLICRALGAISCMYFVSINTPMNDILAALRSWRVPVLLISLMELIYRYISVILEEAHKMKVSQSSRLGYTSFKSSMRCCGELVGMLFLRTYMRSDRIYAALQSRGYDGEFGSINPAFSSSRKTIMMMVILVLVIIAVFFVERMLI